jgi:hypothetical protein
MQLWLLWPTKPAAPAPSDGAALSPDAILLGWAAPLQCRASAPPQAAAVPERLAPHSPSFQPVSCNHQQEQHEQQAAAGSSKKHRATKNIYLHAAAVRADSTVIVQGRRHSKLPMSQQQLPQHA